MSEEREQRSDDLKESDAEAPGPITPEHESGSWEQTLAEQDAREKLQEARTGKAGKSDAQSASTAAQPQPQPAPKRGKEGA